MSANTLKLLEFDDLLSLILGYISSPLGKAKLPATLPGADPETITMRQRLAAEGAEYLRSSTGLPESGKTAARSETERLGRMLPLNFAGLIDPELLVRKAAVEGTILETAEIADLLSFAEKASDIKRVIASSERRFPYLAAEAGGIGEFHSLLRDLRGKILPSGELDDHASLDLKRIRREMEKQRATILSSLKNFLRSQQEDSSTQDEIITIRSERFVVPIPVGKKSRAAGVVHGSSSSGQTVYVEPLETMDLNNELVRLREEEQREIQRILQEMTARLRDQAAAISHSAARLAVLEVAFACGRFALDYNCVIPRVASQSGRLVLKDARHPLLESLLRRKRRSVVPLSITLESENRVLVISGPNTGGKTVALKTIGLLALMAMAGLPVPAAEAEFPLFERILADIGDYQSIQESLSTFSAHLLNISSMIDAMGSDGSSDSLILLDELGAATDPEEGAALGVAVVDRFRSAGAFTIASTHHTLVKAYAMNTAGVISASMGFDEETLQPTYRLDVGHPGNSSGLAIAQKLGLQADVLQRARQTMSAAHVEVEQFLTKLKDETLISQQLRRELEEKLAALAREEDEWRQDLRQREQQRTTAWERKLDELARSFEERSEEKLREIAARTPGESRRFDPKKQAAAMAARLRQQATEELRQTQISHLGETEESDSAAEPTASSREAEVGDRVKLKEFSQPGIVRRKERGWLEVEIGALRTKVSAEDVVEVISLPAQAAARQTPSHAYQLHTQATPGLLTEINVIGATAEEALSRVDKFLDNAFLSQVPRVRIVHGSGKGILRNALAEMFTTHPHVEKFSVAPQKEGGAGATIVELKV